MKDRGCVDQGDESRSLRPRQGLAEKEGRFPVREGGSRPPLSFVAQRHHRIESRGAAAEMHASVAVRSRTSATRPSETGSVGAIPYSKPRRARPIMMAAKSLQRGLPERA